TSGGMVGNFSLGDTTSSNDFVPLIPTSSSCLKFDDGGYLCQPRSSLNSGAFMRSKFPRPAIAALIVIGSPTCTRFGFASAVIEKLPIAPEKLTGAPGGNGFTSSATGSLVISISCCSIRPANGMVKNGSEKGSSPLNGSNGLRRPPELRRATSTFAFS